MTGLPEEAVERLMKRWPMLPRDRAVQIVETVVDPDGSITGTDAVEAMAKSHWDEKVHDERTGIAMARVTAWADLPEQERCRQVERMQAALSALLGPRGGTDG